MAELNEKGELIGIEILNTRTFVWDSIQELVQANVLHNPLPKLTHRISKNAQSKTNSQKIRNRARARQSG